MVFVPVPWFVWYATGSSCVVWRVTYHLGRASPGARLGFQGWGGWVVAWLVMACLALAYSIVWASWL